MDACTVMKREKRHNASGITNEGMQFLAMLYLYSRIVSPFINISHVSISFLFLFWYTSFLMMTPTDHCFMYCIGFATSDEAWCQAQLGLNSGGLGLRSLSLHSSSAYIASVYTSGVVDSEEIHLTNAIDHFNSHVSPIKKLSVNSIIS